MKFICWFFTCYFFLFSDTLLASIYLFYPEDSNPHKKIALEIQKKISKKNETKIEILPSSLKKDLKLTSNDLIVFIGKQNPYDLDGVNKLKTPTIYTFQHRLNIDAIKQKEQWSIIDINQPTKTFIKTGRKLTSKNYKKDILVLITDDDKNTNKLLSQLKNKNNIKIITIMQNDIAAKKIQPELRNAAAIVAINNDRIWSGNSARWLLQQAYSYKVPIIGYSQSFLKAGAMVSIYSSAEQIIQETESQIEEWLITRKLSNKITYPDYNIEINKNIAKALNFSDMEITELGAKQ